MELPALPGEDAPPQMDTVPFPRPGSATGVSNKLPQNFVGVLHFKTPWHQQVPSPLTIVSSHLGRALSSQGRVVWAGSALLSWMGSWCPSSAFSASWEIRDVCAKGFLLLPQAHSDRQGLCLLPVCRGPCSAIPAPGHLPVLQMPWLPTSALSRSTSRCCLSPLYLYPMEVSPLRLWRRPSESPREDVLSLWSESWPSSSPMYLSWHLSLYFPHE